MPRWTRLLGFELPDDNAQQCQTIASSHVDYEGQEILMRHVRKFVESAVEL
jgi:hypothetical protein